MAAGTEEHTGKGPRDAHRAHTGRGPPILDLGLATQWEPEIQVLADGAGEGSSPEP